MWDDIANWWKNLWSEQKPAATAIAGFVSAFVLFLIKDAIWQRRINKLDKREQIKQRQLENFYSPLYQFYLESYSRFDYWRSKNPESTIERQPFFQRQDGETLVERLMAEQSAYASTELIRLWSDFKAADEKIERQERRDLFIQNLIKEYHGLRKSLELDYDRKELATGRFRMK